MNTRISRLRERRGPVLEAAKKSAAGPKSPNLQNNSFSDEGKLNPDHSASLPNASWFPGMSGYAHMRAMILAASYPDNPGIGPSSPVSDHPFSAGYTHQDQEMINHAAVQLGYQPKKLGNKYSEEPDTTHKISPTNHNSGKSK